MNRGRQEKDQLVRKFEEILPFLSEFDSYGWVIPSCDADPVFTIYPAEHDPDKMYFTPVTINVQTGWHSAVSYRDNEGTRNLNEGITKVDSREWSTRCAKSCCIK
jgi:hypothetical protein